MSARVVSFVALASLVVACGASTTSPGGGGDGGGSGSGSSSGSSSSGGSGSGSSSGGSSGGPGSGPCPATAPSGGVTTCNSASLSGVSCEYGSDPDLSCNALFACTNGVWTNTTSTGSQTCPTPAATGACPASYAAAQSAGSCTQSGLACGYPQGRCDCARPTGGPPIVGGLATKWLCDDAPTGCPQPRPHVGAACSASDPQSCDYGACTIPDGVTLACTSGTWQSTPTACAE
jgi:hypothetical protein